MKHLKHWPLVLSLLLFSIESFAKNKTLFEAYYKIISSGTHVGYYIQRYELDQKKKEFISTYFLRTNKAGGNLSESLKAYSTEKLNPVRYQYTHLQGTQAKTIDANSRKNKRGDDVLQIKVNENGKLRVSEKKLASGTFLSTFLIYLLLQGEKGLSTGAKYNFNAIAEEDGKVFPGEVYIDSEQKTKGFNTFKVLYTFKRTQFVNFINSKGESLLSISPSYSLTAEQVAKPEEATQGMPFNQKSVSLLFGGVPAGVENELSKKLRTPAKNTPDKKEPSEPQDKKAEAPETEKPTEKGE